MITVEELHECERLIESGYIAEIWLNKKGVMVAHGGIYHPSSWDRRKITKELFLAIAESYETETRDGYLRIAKKV